MKIETSNVVTLPKSLWDKYVMAIEKVTQQMERITGAFEKAKVPYALVGGQAVALWVSTKDPAAVRTTKNVDILIQRHDLSKANAAARSVNMEYFEVLGVGMFLEKENSNPRHAVHLLWAGEKVRPEYPFPSPSIDNRQPLGQGKQVVSLEGLVLMKLMANRDQDRVHLRDLIGVGLVDRQMLNNLPAELADRLEPLLKEAGL